MIKFVMIAFGIIVAARLISYPFAELWSRYATRMFDFAERTNGDSAFFSIMLLIVCSATHHAIGKCFK
jgi:hypothetical protein